MEAILLSFIFVCFRRTRVAVVSMDPHGRLFGLPPHGDRPIKSLLETFRL
jgi:hypothetical protein